MEEKETSRGFFYLVTATLVAVVIAVITALTLTHSTEKLDEESTNQRIEPVAQVNIATATAGAPGAERSGEQMYQAVCVACHGTGAAGAPKFGDSAAWAPRLKQGLDGLLKSAINGKNAMPPRGGSNATDAELTKAIVYMANKAGGNLKEPSAK
jgi:cytochrome c5